MKFIQFNFVYCLGKITSVKKKKRNSWWLSYIDIMENVNIYRHTREHKRNIQHIDDGQLKLKRKKLPNDS